MNVLVKIVDGWFTRTSTVFQKDVRPVFLSPISFELKKKSKLAVVGDSSKTDFLAILTNKFIPHPVDNRSYPASLNDTNFKLELLKFVNNGSWGHGAHDSSGGFTHLSSRYEFFKDLEVDELVGQFIADQSYNSNITYDKEKVEKLIHSLNLIGLQGQFITTLSNGQFRRARIAKELYKSPSLLCIDDPFLGLDPIATSTVDHVLKKTADDDEIKSTVVIGLRIQDDVPEWIEDIVIINKDLGIIKQGKKVDLVEDLQKLKQEFHDEHNKLKLRIENNLNLGTYFKHDSGEPIIEMNDVDVKYKGNPIIKKLNWTVREGEKWHIRGKNGSGKTTLLSLITHDHPQSWNRSIKVFGVERAPGKSNYFDTNKYIGFTSPELHAIYPKKHTVFQTISTGYIVGSYIPPKLNDEQIKKIDHYLDLLDIKDIRDVKFGEISVSQQKMVLLIRSIINDPKILILDEALSAMTDEDLIKGKALINQLKTTVLCIGHVDEEVPKCDKYIVVNGARRGEYEIGNV